jgi:hypothetical protein
MRSPSASTFFTTRPRATEHRGIRYARRIVNAYHVSYACMQPLCARLVRIMSPTLLPRRYAPATSVRSSYLTLSGCQLSSQVGPGVRLARNRRRRQHCDNNDSQPGASAAAESTATKTMHSPAAFHTAGVAATCDTLARSTTRTT